MKSLHRPKSLHAALPLLMASNLFWSPQAADYASTVQALGPLAYWRMNEVDPVPAAFTAANSGTLGEAATGYGVLDVAGGEPGIVGNACRFVNSSWSTGTCGSKIDVAYLPAMNPTGSFSVEFWAKPTKVPTDLFCPVSALNGYSGRREGWLFYTDSGSGGWMFRLGAGSGYAGAAIGGRMKGNEWQHVVGVYNATAHTVSLFVDGVLVAGPSATTTTFIPNPFRSFRMGGTGLDDGSLGAYAGQRGFDGWLDEVAFYGAPLPADRVAAHYAAATTNPTGYAASVLADSPMGYWQLNEPAYVAPDPTALPVAANSGSLGGTANGTYRPGAANGIAGPPGSGFGVENRAVQLNGTVGNVAVTNVPGLNFEGNATLMAWVKPSLKDTFRNIVAHGHITTPGNAELSMRISSGNYQGGAWDGTDYRAAYAVPAGDLGNWVFLATTYDGTAWKLYRNGELAGTLAGGIAAFPMEASWSIGSQADPAPADGRFFGGAIDEVAIFNKALSAAQIRSVFQAAGLAPVITQQPTAPASAAYEGDTVSLSVVAEGTPPLSYQWYKDGTPIPGKTAASLSFNPVKASDTGVYTVVVTNPNGPTTSAAVSLVITATPPSISAQPQSITRFASASASFKVSAGGSAPLAYQWRKNGNPISGATSSTLKLSNLTTTSGGEFTCVITNPQGQVTTDPATLTVLPITGAYAATILADQPLSYWRLGETGGTVAHDYWNGIDGEYRGVTQGADGFSLLDSDKAAAFTGKNTYVGGISGTDIDFTGPGVSFTLEAWVKGSATQVAGAGIIAKGTGTDGGNGDEQFAIDVNSGKYRFYVRKASDNTAMECQAGNSGPNGAWQHLVAVYDASTLSMMLYVNGVQEGAMTASDAGPRTSSHPISIGARRGGVDPVYDLFFNGTVDEVAIYDKALDSDKVAAHFQAQYGVGQKPIVQVPPQSITNYIGLPAKLSVAVAGTPPMEYQWKKNGANIAGQTSDTLSFPTLVNNDTANYTVVAVNPVGSVTSTVARITVLANPTTAPAIRGLVTHLKFDDNLLDATGRGNNGTKVGDTSFVSDGKLGSALHYWTDTNDPLTSAYVDLGLRPDLQFSTNVNFTVAFWIRLPLYYVGNDLPMFGNALNSANNRGYNFAPSYSTTVAGGWGWSLYGPGSGINVYGAVGTINDGGWHHLVFSFDRKGLGVTYLDGVQADSRLITSVGDLDSGLSTVIGQDPSGTYPESGSADIDELAVFRRALLPLEAASIFAASRNNLSFTGETAPINLVFEKTAQGGFNLTWPAGALQSADQASGPYSNVPGALPPYTVSPSEAGKYYRVRLQ